MKHGNKYSNVEDEDMALSNSGILLLLITKLKKKKLNEAFSWGEKQHTAVKKCKKSVITSANGHHGSSGEYYSFGNSAMYRTQNLSSIGQYKKNWD